MSFIVYLISVNLVSFFFCFLDKWKAVHKRWRISEFFLLLLSFVGGCFGMALGMRVFHHKTRKFKFYLVYLFCILWVYFGYLHNC